MKKTEIYVSYNFMVDGRPGLGDIKIVIEREDNKGPEMSWETLESWKEIIRDEAERATGLRPQLVTFNTIIPLEPHDPDVVINTSADIGEDDEEENIG